MQNRIEIPYQSPSQNKYNKMHWSERSKDRDRARAYIRVAMIGKERATAGNVFNMHITAYRKKRCYDTANLVGGMKGMVDALVLEKVIYDDADKCVTITYEQHPVSKSPSGKLCTVIEWEKIK